jgi:cytochrome b561
MTTKPITLEAPKRYNPALASFHWIIALLIFTNVILASAAEGEHGRAPVTVFGIPVIGIHMLTGITILVLLTLRLITRLSTKRPAPATAGHALLDKIGVLTHYALYFFTYTMTISGIVMAAQRGYFAKIFGIGSVAQNSQRSGLGALHGLSWVFLGLFILLHLGATLYHQFIRRDHLLGRMWFGN